MWAKRMDYAFETDPFLSVNYFSFSISFAELCFMDAWIQIKCASYRPAEPNVHILLSKKVHIRLCRSVDSWFTVHDVRVEITNYGNSL